MLTRLVDLVEVSSVSRVYHLQNAWLVEHTVDFSHFKAM